MWRGFRTATRRPQHHRPRKTAPFAAYPGLQSALSGTAGIGLLAVRLKSGKVLVAGGTPTDPPQQFSEVYDPATRGWRTTGVMRHWRASPAAVLLPDGKVFVVGGFGEPGRPNDTAETYDPATERWADSGAMSEPRADVHTATLLRDGRVLVAGGPAGLAELYDPLTGQWSVTGTMLVGDGGHTATLLPDGRVMVAGGIDTTGTAVATTQLYDPRAGTWTAATAMHDAREEGQAVTLTDGRILVTGGANTTGALTATELFSIEGD